MTNVWRSGGNTCAESHQILRGTKEINPTNPTVIITLIKHVSPGDTPRGTPRGGHPGGHTGALVTPTPSAVSGKTTQMLIHLIGPD